MNRTTRIVLICICSLLIIATMVAMVFAGINYYGGKNKAHAEYEDLAGTTTLVNFNQLLKITSVQSGVTAINDYTIKNESYTSGYFPCNIQTISFISGHKYYLKGSSDYRIYFASGGGITAQFDNIYTAASNISSYQIFTNQYTLGTFSFNVIDLTQMFGDGNEPNLEQAQEYFTTYYNYTDGNLIPYSKDFLQGYQAGADDLLESLTITYNAFTIGASSTTYGNDSIERGEILFDTTYGYYMFSRVIGINLMGNVERGTYFDVDYTILVPDFSGESQTYKLSFYLVFAYVDDNNNLINITSIAPTNEGNYNTYQGSFVLPITTQKIYCFVGDNDNNLSVSSLQCYAFKSDLTFKSTDIGLLMNNSYQRGYSDMQLRYNPNGDLYNEIWTLGYNNGLAAQNATLGTMEYIGAAFSGIGSILQIELLPGVPFSLFVLLPLMFGLIAFVVKLTRGGD